MEMRRICQRAGSVPGLSSATVCVAFRIDAITAQGGYVIEKVDLAPRSFDNYDDHHRGA